MLIPSEGSTDTGIVARGLASRLRLKFATYQGMAARGRSRQGIGFSSEIEITQNAFCSRTRICRQGIGFSSEIEITMTVSLSMTCVESPGDWLLV